VQAVVDTI